MLKIEDFENATAKHFLAENNGIKLHVLTHVDFHEVEFVVTEKQNMYSFEVLKDAIEMFNSLIKCRRK